MADERVVGFLSRLMPIAPRILEMACASGLRWRVSTLAAWMVCLCCVVTPGRCSAVASGKSVGCGLFAQHVCGGSRAAFRSGAQAVFFSTLRLRGGAAAAKPGGLFAASVSRWQHDDIMQESAVHLAFAVNTTTVSWIGKSSVKEVMSLVMRKCVESTNPGDFARVEHELQGRKAYCYVISRHTGIAATVMTNAEYPERVAINFLDMLLDEFTEIYGNAISQSGADDCMDFPELEERMADFQDPASADVVEKIKKDMYESEKVLQKNVESILERGQKLEDLIMQSEQLSMQTKMMYKSVDKSPGWFEDCCGLV